MAPRTTEPDYYAEFLAEREEIRRYKWIMSEKEGHDIGFERALTEWTARHREDWRREREERRGT
jgi:hypothetical protein